MGFLRTRCCNYPQVVTLNVLVAVALPWTPLRELTALPRPMEGQERGLRGKGAGGWKGRGGEWWEGLGPAEVRKGKGMVGVDEKVGRGEE